MDPADISTLVSLNNTSSTTIGNALASSHAETSDVQETIHPGPSSLPYNVLTADTSTPAPLNNTSRTTIMNALAALSHTETSDVQETIQPGHPCCLTTFLQLIRLLQRL